MNRDMTGDAAGNPDNLAGAAAARWLALSPDARANAGLMAPSHAIRERINEIVRERLVRDGTVHGPAMAAERLVSKGYTNAEKTLSSNYRAGDVVAFHRPYKRLGVGKGDELRVAGVDNKARTRTGARDAMVPPRNRGSRNGPPGRTWRTRGRRRASIATSGCSGASAGTRAAVRSGTCRDMPAGTCRLDPDCSNA